MDPTIMFILQGLFAVLMLFFGYILNSMRLSMDNIRSDLKVLNDAVLGKYALTEEILRWRSMHLLEEAKWKETHALETQRVLEEQRKLDHEMRDHIQIINVTLAKMQGKPYADK